MNEPGVDLSSVINRIRHRHVVGPGSERAFAAVSLLLRDGPEGAEVLFIQRAEHDGDPWSGHMAFPGGKPEAGDQSLLETAVRETFEETGLRLARTSLVARLPDAETHTHMLRVAGFVFALPEEYPALELGPEVQRAVWVSLKALLAPENSATVERTRAGKSVEFPCITVAGHVVWGLTYQLTQHLLELVASD